MMGERFCGISPLGANCNGISTVLHCFMLTKEPYKEPSYFESLKKALGVLVPANKAVPESRGRGAVSVSSIDLWEE